MCFLFDSIKHFGWLKTFEFVGLYLRRQMKCVFGFYSNELQVENYRYKVSYEDSNQNQYFVMLQKKRGRSRNEVLHVKDRYNFDVLDDFKKWYGPFYDFHSTKVTPHDIGYDYLIVELLDGRELGFNEYDIITFE